MYPHTTALIVVALVVLGVPAGAGTSQAAQNSGADIHETVVTTARGGVASVTVVPPDNRSATVVVTSPDSALRIRLAAADGNGDGVVTVRLNTFLASQNPHSTAAYAAAVAADRVDVVDVTAPPDVDAFSPGRYPVRVFVDGVQRDAALLRITPPTFGDVVFATAPDGADPAAATPTETGTVAANDWAVLRFDADGVEGLLAAARTSPRSNLVAAEPATPGVASTHRVRVPVADGVEPLRTVTIDYDAGDGGEPNGAGGFSAKDVRRVGVDTDGDGLVETRLDGNLSAAAVPGEGRIRLVFEDGRRLDVGDVLVLRYDLANPARTGEDNVSVAINDRQEIRGTVVYGLAGQGSLGNGLDLEVAFVEPGRAPVPLSTAGVRLLEDERNGTVSAALDTDGLPRGQYRATLSLMEGSRIRGNGSSTATETFAVVDRRAVVTAPLDDGRVVVGQGPVTVRGTSTLAPGSSVVVMASRFDSQPFVMATATTIMVDGSWSVHYDFSDVRAGAFTVQVFEGRVLLPDDSELLLAESQGRVRSTR